MLTVIHTTHSRSPWRLAWHGRVLEDVWFPTRREAQTACRELLTIADFGRPGPEAWAAGMQERVDAYVRELPCRLELARLRERR